MKITIQVGISMYKGGGDTKPLDDIKLFNESLAIIIEHFCFTRFQNTDNSFFLEKYLRHRNFHFHKFSHFFFFFFSGAFLAFSVCH